mmetsp:Transcript_2050/g.4102  ORF Transcript_2050/g.4102 Transcript_2050/m.4102 type:complete len:616 (-) Transcript_2050:497-2344(-)
MSTAAANLPLTKSPTHAENSLRAEGTTLTRSAEMKTIDYRRQYLKSRSSSACEEASLPPVSGVDLRWEHLSLKIPTTGGDKRAGGKRQNDKIILNDCSGALQKREMACIIGPSGAGKTTLMHTLSGRAGRSYQGRVLANGCEVNPIEFRKSLAFVMQEEALFATQTPREAVSFSAALRLHGVQAEERKTLVASIIRELNLDKCADTLIGGELIRGISGGEKRRVSIGIEMITNPKILFLDEPTSGLDSSSAYSVVMTLQRLCSRGCSVMCTIHQPSSEIFHTFDKCFLIVEGHMLYAAESKLMPEFFEQQGMGCPPTFNMADHAMFIVNRTDHQGIEDVKKLREAWKEREQKALGEHKEEDDAAINNTNTRALRSPSSSGSGLKLAAHIHAGGCMQIGQLAKREVLGLFRDKQTMMFRVFSAIFLSLLFGIVFFGVGKDNVPESIYGALTLISMATMFGSSHPQLVVFAIERKAFLREYFVGTYGVQWYFLTKFIVETLVAFVFSLISLSIVYPLMQLQGNFVAMWMALFLLSIASQSLTTVIGCISTSVKQAMELFPVAFVPQFLFSGFFVRIDQIPVWLQWVQWVCVFKSVLTVFLTLFLHPHTTKASRFRWA